MRQSILYVDDEIINLQLFKSIFFLKYEVHLAESAVEGLEILAENKIDLIITDQRMPEMTGIEFLEKVLDKFPDIPPFRLLTSGYSKPESIQKAFEKFNLDNFVKKPWDVVELKKVVDDLLQKN